MSKITPVKKNKKESRGGPISYTYTVQKILTKSEIFTYVTLLNQTFWTLLTVVPSNRFKILGSNFKKCETTHLNLERPKNYFYSKVNGKRA